MAPRIITKYFAGTGKMKNIRIGRVGKYSAYASSRPKMAPDAPMVSA